MESVCADSRSYFDPFCGSGTVLYEASERGHDSWGVELNPAAWHLAVLAEVVSLNSKEKQKLLQHVKIMLLGSAANDGDLFQRTFSTQDALALATNGNSDFWATRIAACAIILGMGNGDVLDGQALQRGLSSISSVLNRVARCNAEARCALADARETGLGAETAEAVITSPPYINVFNYHQNYRRAVEMLGWHPLQAARVEIGANRKFRQNRFLTVVQYCVDMQLALVEIARVLKADAPVVLILGRTSNVLGCAFENGSIMRRLLKESGGFDDVRSMERAFTSRFGELIREDIIIARRRREFAPDAVSARLVGREALVSALKEVSEKNRAALMGAVEFAPEVQASGTLQIDVPPQFLVA